MEFCVDEEYTEHELSNDVKCFDNFLYESDYKTMNDILKSKFNGNNGLRIWHSSVGHHPYTTTHYSLKLDDLFFHEYIVNKICQAVDMDLTPIRIYASLQKFGEVGNFHSDDALQDTYTFTLYTCFTLNPTTKLNFLSSTQFEHLNASTYKDTLDFNVYNETRNQNNDIDNKQLKKTILQQKCDKLNNYNHDGHFYIIVPSSNDIKTIPFVINRSVFFPSMYTHNGGTFNQNHQFTRVVVSFKLMKKKHI